MKKFKFLIVSELDVVSFIANDVDKTITHVVSIGNPDKAEHPTDFGNREVLRLLFHDTGIASTRWAKENGYSLPTKEDVAKLIEFSTKLDDTSKVIIHCAQGISRSPAAAIVMLLSMNEKKHDEAIMRLVCDSAISGVVRPNTWMLKFAEELFQRPENHLLDMAKNLMPATVSPYGNWA